MLAVILLATHNGERYLEEQLDSIFAQSYADFLLIAKDDCSSDDTLGILQRYRQQFPEQLQLLPSERQNQGPIQMFSGLLEYILKNEKALGSDDYCIAFCDQDDIWHADKLRVSIDRLQQQRAQHADDTALLIHSELSVIDSHGQTMCPRYSVYQGLTPERSHFADILVQNVVTGCACTITPELARLSVPIPLNNTVMHDWWIALIASLRGKICYIEQPLVQYRQHSANTIGAKAFKNRDWREKIASLLDDEFDDFYKTLGRQARYVRAHRPCRLGFKNALACLIVGYLFPPRNLVSRAIALKSIKLLRLL